MLKSRQIIRKKEINYDSILFKNFGGI